MAFALKGAGGTVNSASANQSTLVLTTATTAGASNDLAVLRYAVDNNQTTDGDEGAVTGIADSVGSNVWVKGAEFTNGQGSAQAGATCGVWYCNLRGGGLPIGSTVTLTFSNNTSRDASAAALEIWTKAAGFDAAVEGTPGTLAADAAAAGSLDVTTANIACLRIRAVASESSTATALTKTAAFTAVLSQDLSSSGASATNQGIRGEYLISTGTGQASSPTAGAGSVDHASVYVAFKEVAQTVLVNGWQRGAELVRAAVPVWSALLLATQATQFAAPGPAAASNSVSQYGWHQPLSRAVPVAKAIQGHATVPFNTAQVAPVQPDGWRVQPPVAPRNAVAVPTQATSFQSPAPPDNNTTAKAWLQPLSTAPKTAQAVPTQPVIPFLAAETPRGWFQPLSTAPRLAVISNASGLTFVSTPFAVDNNTTAKAWYLPLSGAPKTVSAIPTQATSFQTPAQAASNSVTQLGWHQPLSKAVAVAKAQQGHAFVPLNTPQLVTPIALVYDASSPRTQFVYYQAWARPPAFIAPADNNTTAKAWQQPLSQAAPVARAVHSQPTFVSVPPDAPRGWYQPLSVAVPVAQARQGHAFVPFNTAQAVAATVVTLAWQQPLSVAPKTATAVHTALSFVALPFAQYPIGWYQPLAGAPPVAKAQQGHAFVPFNTAQTPPAGIAGMAWHQPLGTVGLKVNYLPVPSTFWAPTELSTVAPPVVETSVGGGGWVQTDRRKKRKKRIDFDRLDEIIEGVLEADTVEAVVQLTEVLKQPAPVAPAHIETPITAEWRGLQARVRQIDALAAQTERVQAELQIAEMVAQAKAIRDELARIELEIQDEEEAFLLLSS